MRFERRSPADSRAFFLRAKAGGTARRPRPPRRTSAACCARAFRSCPIAGRGRSGRTASPGSTAHRTGPCFGRGHGVLCRDDTAARSCQAESRGRRGASNEWFESTGPDRFIPVMYGSRPARVRKKRPEKWIACDGPPGAGRHPPRRVVAFVSCSAHPSAPLPARRLALSKPRC